MTNWLDVNENTLMPRSTHNGTAGDDSSHLSSHTANGAYLLPISMGTLPIDHTIHPAFQNQLEPTNFRPGASPFSHPGQDTFQNSTPELSERAQYLDMEAELRNAITDPV